MSDSGFSYLGDLSVGSSGYVLPPIGWNDRTLYFDMAAKKDAVKLPSTGQYYYNIYDQLFKPVDEDIDYEFGQLDRKYADNFIRYITSPSDLQSTPQQFILDNAPSLAYDVNRYAGDQTSQAIPSFEGIVATAILTGTANFPDGTSFGPINTAEDVDRFVTRYFEEGWGEPPPGSTLPAEQIGITDRRAYAKGLFIQKDEARKKWEELRNSYDADGAAIYDKRGLPSRDLRYDPTSVDGYTDWENKKISELRAANKDVTSQEVEIYKSKLRKAAADEYAKQGYSPFYDAILLARAGS